MQRYKHSHILTSNMILYPNLFRNQGLPVIYAKDYYIWNMLAELPSIGIDVEAFTETEGGAWLPGSYLRALQSCHRDMWTLHPNRLDSWLAGVPTLWEMTRVHALLLKTPNGRLIRWDNINGFDKYDYAIPEIIEEGKLRRLQQRNPVYHSSLDEMCVVDQETGLEFLCEYKVTSWGSTDSWYEPGDPVELDLWHVSLYDGALPLDMMDRGYDELIQRLEAKLCESVEPPDYDEGDHF